MKSVTNIVVDADGIAADEKKFHFKWTKQMFHASLESRDLVFELTGVSSEFRAKRDSPDLKNINIAMLVLGSIRAWLFFATYCYLSKPHHLSTGVRNKHATCKAPFLSLVIAKLPED